MKILIISPALLKLGLLLRFESQELSYTYYMAWARERAGWTKSRAVIGYPTGQDDIILRNRDYPLCSAGKIPPKATKQIPYWLRLGP